MVTIPLEVVRSGGSALSPYQALDRAYLAGMNTRALRLACIVLAMGALAACGGEGGNDAAPAPSASTEPAAVETTTQPAALTPPVMRRSEVVKKLGLTPYNDGSDTWHYTTKGGEECDIPNVMITADEVALYRDAGDVVATNGEWGVTIAGDPYGNADDGGYAAARACWDELVQRGGFGG